MNFKGGAKTKVFEVLCIFVLALSNFFILHSEASASTTNGVIDGTSKYAWGENLGWINFGANGSNVLVTDAGLSGYAWSENYGWINLNPSASGVTNDGNGNLSGRAWGENLGWINFASVIINDSGEFTGYATIDRDNSKISFNCSNTSSCGASDFKVKTDWRKNALRDGGAAGGGGSYAVLSSGNSFLIDGGESTTNSRIVKLQFTLAPDVKNIAISGSPDFSQVGLEPAVASKDWDLCTGSRTCPEGSYTIYVKFYNEWGGTRDAVVRSIMYKISLILPEEKVIPPTPPVEAPSEVKPAVPAVPSIPHVPQAPATSIGEKIFEFLEPILPEFLKPKPPVPSPPPVAMVTKETPLAFRGGWQLISQTSIRELVLAPLPKDISLLAARIPQLEKTFEQIGIKKITDVGKLANVQLTLPGLAEVTGLPSVEIAPGKFALPTGIPVAKLSLAEKMRLPAEIVFTRAGNDMIDLQSMLTVTNQGAAEQRIETVAGKTMQLIVKPEKPVRGITGYIIFKSKAAPATSAASFPLSLLSDSLFLPRPVLAEPEVQPVEIENKLVLAKFQYVDRGDGIYTADVAAPLAEGEYEIITVMDYEDVSLGAKAIRLITVVDPEGYIYERFDGKEIRIPGAIASLYWLNKETKAYELWPAKDFQQENPQVTDITGKYSFLVPEGTYYIKVEAPGYLAYNGKPFEVQQGSGIHENIELRSENWWLGIVDWKTLLLILVIILLVYNFYRDRLREKSKNKS